MNAAIIEIWKFILKYEDFINMKKSNSSNIKVEGDQTHGYENVKLIFKY